jgi:hypothetical protein
MEAIGITMARAVAMVLIILVRIGQGELADRPVEDVRFAHR